MTFTKLAVVFGALGCAAAGASIAYGTIGDGGTISACYDKTSGQVRVYDPTGGSIRNCQTHETGISWSVEGPQGPRGPQGVAGRNGIAGPTSLGLGAGNVDTTPSTLASHTFTAAEAGLNLIWATGFATKQFQVYDGPDTLLACSLRRPGQTRSRAIYVQSHGSEWFSFLGRGQVAAGEEVEFSCRKVSGPGEPYVEVQLLLAKVGS